MIGASEMLFSGQDLLSAVPHIGIQGLAGYLIPAHLLLMGVLLWLNPVDRIIYSLIAIFLALWSWTTSNLGGFFVGMLLSMVGGALAFAWTTDAKHGSSGRRVRGKQRNRVVRVHQLQQLSHLSGLGGVVRNAVIGAGRLLLVRHRRERLDLAVGDMAADFAGVLCPGQHPRDSDLEHEDRQEAAPAPLCPALGPRLIDDEETRS